VTRHGGGSDSARPAAYRHVEPPVFAGQWNWTDANGQAQPQVTLFSDLYSANNPHLRELDQRYRAFAINLRDADCESCHVPDGHKLMRKLTLLNTPLHTAGQIEEALRSVRETSMPVNKQGDKVKLEPALRETLLRNGDEFRRLLHEADAWEKANNTGRAAHRRAPRGLKGRRPGPAPRRPGRDPPARSRQRREEETWRRARTCVPPAARPGATATTR
jgi:hypothetical protein